jgi:hypothetical protein
MGSEKLYIGIGLFIVESIVIFLAVMYISGILPDLKTLVLYGILGVSILIYNILAFYLVIKQDNAQYTRQTSLQKAGLR